MDLIYYQIKLMINIAISLNFNNIMPDSDISNNEEDLIE